MIYIKETQLALIHIPLHLYSCFLQPILQLLFPVEDPLPFGNNDKANGQAARPPYRQWTSDHPFANISITPIECSIVCSRAVAQALFVPVREGLSPGARSQVSITHEDYIVMQVDGEGLDAGQRVLDLTSPLALAGISIFFITTYFSDYILVPVRCRDQVIDALRARGFAFEHQTSTYVSPHNRNRSSGSSFEVSHNSPKSPPPRTVGELQTRTFATLKRRNIRPAFDPEIRLVQCAGRKDSMSRTSNGFVSRSNAAAADDALHLGLVKCLIASPRPQFLSLTLTDTEPASLLLDRRMLSNFPPVDCLLGSKDDFLIPIMLDLRDLPLESTGIVCGVAGRLVGGTARLLESPVEMSYLSTARAGTVMVAEYEVDRAFGALKEPENDVMTD